MAAVVLDNSQLRKAKPKELVAYFNHLRLKGCTDAAICKAILESVDAELQESSATAVFLLWSYQPEVIALYIKHGPSRWGRTRAIKLAGKLVADPSTWKRMWVALGDTQGWVELFATASVEEVKLLARALGYCGKRAARVGDREKVIEELLQALLPQFYPGSSIASCDKRPIQRYFASMLPACSDDFTNNILDTKDDTNPLYKHFNLPRFMEARSSFMWERVDAAVFGRGKGEGDKYLPVDNFLFRDATFAVNAVKLRLKNPRHEPWPQNISELDVVLYHLKRMQKIRGRPDSEIRPMISLALQVIQAKGLQVNRNRCPELWSVLCARWWEQPELYEPLFIAGLRLDLAGGKPSIGQGYFISKNGKAPVGTWSWNLLRLYCLHVPPNGIDIETATDYKPLGKQLWSANVFFEISRDQAKQVLHGLYDAHSDYNFLDPDPRSILSLREIGPMSYKNFNADLLLAMLKDNSEESLEDAKSAVDRLRRKSSSSKEQVDRAEIGKAASFYAIATGNLDLYAETVEWQLRFIRDPLTVKTIFSANAVTSKEGIALLCGIHDALPKHKTLADVVTGMERGNDIMKIFGEAMHLAKREPSFSEQDWHSINTLPELVFKERVLRARKLQEEDLCEKKVDVFEAVWESGLVLADKIRSGLQAMHILFSSLAPDDLAAATRMMLRSGDERRKEQDRQIEDDILEHMSYRALERLASSAKPYLAKSLVLRTVVERPDASSWHRTLLSVGFLKRLGAKDAQDMILSFAAAIGEKLEEQSYVKVGEAEPNKAAPPRSIVKVTTVKYLAQLLDNAEFVSTDAAIEVLVELFRNGTHRDVRLATLDSLLSALNDICNQTEETLRSNPLTEKILSALETVIPIAGSINEQFPPREQDWLEAREKGILPNVSDVSSAAPPLLSTFFASINGNMYPNLRKLRSEFVSRFMLPILARSEKEQRRWVSLFLKKYNANIESSHIPPTPITPLLWGMILDEHAHLVPSKVLEDYYRYIATTLAPSQDLQDFNEMLQSKSSLRNVPEVKHWLQIYSQSPNDHHSAGLWRIRSIVQTLYTHGKSFIRGIDMYVSLLSSVLDDYENKSRVWAGFVNQYRTPLRFNSNEDLPIDYPNWKDTSRPVLEKATALLLDRKRNMARLHVRGDSLPLAHELRLFLLPYPLSRDEAEAEAQRRHFAVELGALILSTFQSEMNVLQWSKVATATEQISVLLEENRDRVRLASCIGQLQEAEATSGTRAQLLSAMNLVKFKTAARLIQDGWNSVELSAKDKDEAVVNEKKILSESLKELVRKWQRCADGTILGEVTEWRRQHENIWSQLTES